MHRSISVEKKIQLDATECLIAPIIYATCFGHLYAHHQQLETILVLLPHMVCDAAKIIPITHLYPHNHGQHTNTSITHPQHI